MYDVAVIGGGPGGITAAIYLARAGLKTIIFEGMFFGGQIVNSVRVDNYPAMYGISGFDLATKLHEQLKEFDVTIVNKKVIEASLKGETKIIKTKKDEYEVKAVVIATGASPRKLNALNEDKYTSLGVSYCATCDGAFYKDKDVCVIGGGNTALDDALYLAKFVNKVTLIHRREEFRADKITVNKVKENPKIEILYNEQVAEFLGDEKLNKVLLKSGKELSVDGAFIAVGNIPQTEIFKDEIELTESGFIKANRDLETNIPLVYGVGDVTDKKLRQLITAESDGAIAANEIINILQKEQ